MTKPNYTLRIVKIFLVDTDERVPVEDRILHRSEEMTTDATDEELFYQVPVQELLEKHNKKRADREWEEQTKDGERKTRKGLKPLRIRDLAMHVSVIAEFA